MGFTGRIIKRTQKSTLIYDGNRIIKLNFKTSHSIGDIIDEHDNLLTKCFYALPPERTIRERERLKRRFLYLRRIHQFFNIRGFEFVITKKLKKHPTNETNIKYIKTSRGFMATSPETELKKLLSLGFAKIYELGFAYRDDPEDCLHAPEFLMLEWYRINSTPERIINDLTKLIKYLHGKNIIKYHRKAINISICNYISYEETFKKFVGIDPTTTPTQEMITRFNVLGTEERLEVLDAIFSTHIEKHLGTSSITVVYNFPAERANLSRVDGKYAKRYEVYMGGIELANCYQEETNYKALLERNLLTDIGFNKAIAHGIPPASGIAVGVERLIMILENESCITPNISIF